MQVRLIVASVEPCHGIGYNDDLVYHCKLDSKRFQTLTMNGILVMGRNTFENLPTLKSCGRSIIVLSSGPVTRSYNLPYIVVRNTMELSEYMEGIKHEEGMTDKVVWICGGQRLYDWALSWSIPDTVEWTQYHLKKKVPCDTFFTPKLDSYVKVKEERHPIDGGEVIFTTWQKSNREELAYLELMRKVLNQPVKVGRNGQTWSLFGEGQLSFNLCSTFPLLTSRKIWFKGVVGELLFFLSGKTDTKLLEKQKINIWKGNTSREFLDQKNLKYHWTEFELESKIGVRDVKHEEPYKEGDMGPGYGFQWRHWGADYVGCDVEYGGIDQITMLLTQLKNDPMSRRHILSAWNVSDLSKMALEPCHILAQFNCSQGYVDSMFDVDEDNQITINGYKVKCLDEPCPESEKIVGFPVVKKYFYTLDTHVYMRSCDTFHGLPFNIASYALLNRIFCQELGYLPGKLTFSFGDLHIYKSHLEAVNTLLTRIPTNFPQLHMAKKPWDKLTPEDFTLSHYTPGPDIKVPMVV